MKRGYRKTIKVHCATCGDLCRVTALRGESFTPAEVAEMQQGYECADCERRRLEMANARPCVYVNAAGVEVRSGIIFGNEDDARAFLGPAVVRWPA